MKLNSTFRAVADKMAIDFERLAAEIEHRGEAGEARELALRGFLSDYLPKRAPVDTGFVIDAAGGTSEQMDIVIYDRAYAVEFDVLEKHYYPCQTVIAVGQVKTSIASTDRLREALDNIASAKILDRSGPPMTGPGYSTPNLGERYDPLRNHRDQIFGFIFTGKSLQQETLIGELQTWQAEHLRRIWPNVYCDFQRFLISYFSDNLVTSAMEARGMYCTRPEEQDGLLLLLFALLANFVNEAHIARPNFFEYAGIEGTDHDSYFVGDDPEFQAGPAV
jgi:Domain of unknown function (DUF6602)